MHGKPILLVVVPSLRVLAGAAHGGLDPPKAAMISLLLNDTGRTLVP